MSRVNDGVAQSQYPSLKAFHDEVGVTGGDSWDEFYNTYRFGYDPTNLQLGDRMARFWNSPANSIYARATFALDARRTPGVPAAGNTTMDLSSNALRVRNGTTGNAKIVQDGRGGKALQGHGGIRASLAASNTSGLLTIGCTVEAEITWPTGNFSAFNYLASEDGADGNRRWALYAINGGTSLFIEFRDSANNGVGFTLTRPVCGGSAGGRSRFRATLTEPTAGNWRIDCNYWDGSAWVGGHAETKTAAAGGLNTGSTAAFHVGSSRGSVNQWPEQVHAVRILDSSLEPLAEFDPSRDASYSSLSWTSATTGETWTVTPGGSDNSDVLFLPAPSTLGVSRYVYLPGSAGNTLTVPDTAIVDFTTDAEVVVACSLADWTPASSSLLYFRQSGNAGLYLQVLSSNRLLLAWGTGSALWTANVLLAGELVDGQSYWLRARLDVDNGSGDHVVTFEYAPFAGTSEPTTWSAFTNAVTYSNAGSTTTIAPVTTVAQLGNASTQTNLYRVIVRDGIDGPVVFDWSAEDTVTATHTSFTASTGQTVTVNRVTSGRKTAVVEAAKWLLGADDYIEVADNALLDFGAGDSFTVLAVVRLHGTNSEELVTKSASMTGVDAGYSLYSLSVGGVFYVKDGAANPYDQSNAGTRGQITSFAGVRDVGTDTLGAWVNDTLVAPTTDTTTATLANTQPLYIGRAASAYGDLELYAVYIWREALTASELAAIAADWGAV